MLVCRSCGAGLPDVARYCARCGAPVGSAVTPPPTPPSSSTAPSRPAGRRLWPIITAALLAVAVAGAVAYAAASGHFGEGADQEAAAESAVAVTTDEPVPQVVEPEPEPVAGPTDEWVSIDWGGSRTNELLGIDTQETVRARLRLLSVEWVESVSTLSGDPYDRVTLTFDIENTGEAIASYSMYVQASSEELPDPQGMNNIDAGVAPDLAPEDESSGWGSGWELGPSESAEVIATVDVPAGYEAADLTALFYTIIRLGGRSIFDVPVDPYVAVGMDSFWSGRLVD